MSQDERKISGLVSISNLLPGLERQLPALQSPKSLSNIQNRMIEAAEAIRDGRPEDIAFQHSVLCQTSLPYRRTPLRRWEAQNGNVMLLVQAGEAYDREKQQWVELPLPFGPKARLILMYLNSEAIRTRSPIIEVENSMTAFLRQLQRRDPNGDEIQKFKQQLSALAQAKISMASADPGLSAETGWTPHANLPIVKFIDLWFTKNANQRVLWPGTIELTTDYFEDLTKHAVPLDQRAIAALSHSAMALDAYSWLAQRLWRVPPGKPYRVAWARLHQQFGSGYKQIRQWRKVFLKTLKDVQMQYPDAKLDHDAGGLCLHHSAPPVRKKPIQLGP
ncbi:MAG: replication protein RepA [Acidobacteriota bacterium]